MSQLLKQLNFRKKKIGKKKLILDLKIGEFLDKDIGDVQYLLRMMKKM